MPKSQKLKEYHRKYQINNFKKEEEETPHFCGNCCHRYNCTDNKLYVGCYGTDEKKNWKQLQKSQMAYDKEPGSHYYIVGGRD